jgi:DNA-binding NtrC family response regulator
VTSRLPEALIIVGDQIMVQSLRILILEDNPTDAELIQFELQEAGLSFTARVVMTESDFLRELLEFQPDLILSDYDLSQYNGALALGETRRRYPDTPFILVTGAISEDHAIEIFTQGAKDYVLKSRLQQRLVPAVRRALAEAEEQRARRQAEAELRKAHRTLEERVRTRTLELETEISARRKIEEALKKAHDKLEQQVEERTFELQTALSEIKSMKDRLEAENIYLRHESKMKHRFENILGQSNGLKYVLYRAEQVAPTNTTVLILGETGTGKELIASAIHNMSPRKERPLITVNCAALPGNLIESELFGREKGAFTGADTRQVGRFEIANNSTLCLDEIGELPMELQAKLLRVIQHNEFERLGSSNTVKVDVRIVATTNRNLEEEVRNGRFRQDLYYRLNVFPITIPPLRQRKEDIPLIVQAFIERYSRKLGKQITSIQKETMEALQEYPWPGNVRELESIIERAVILCPGPVLQLADKLEISPLTIPSTMRTLEETERTQILNILEETRWRIEGKEGAASILGLHPSTLRARMHKLGVFRPETPKPGPGQNV